MDVILWYYGKFAKPHPSMMIDKQGQNTAAGGMEGEYALTLGDLLRILRKRFWVIALVAVVLVGAAVGFTLAQTPMYEASIKILIGQESGITENPNEVAGLQQLTQTMAEAVSSRPVAEAVIEQLGLLRITPNEFLENNLSAEQISNTQFIRVAYRDSDPERARQVANAVGEVFSDQISEVSPNANAIAATVWEQASLPQNPVSPNYPRNILAALILGTALGVGLALLLEFLDDSWRSPEEAEQISGVPTFGVIPELEAPKGPKAKGKQKGEES